MGKAKGIVSRRVHARSTQWPSGAAVPWPAFRFARTVRDLQFGSQSKRLGRAGGETICADATTSRPLNSAATRGRADCGHHKRMPPSQAAGGPETIVSLDLGSAEAYHVSRTPDSGIRQQTRAVRHSVVVLVLPSQWHAPDVGPLSQPRAKRCLIGSGRGRPRDRWVAHPDRPICIAHHQPAIINLQETSPKAESSPLGCCHRRFRGRVPHFS